MNSKVIYVVLVGIFLAGAAGVAHAGPPSDSCSLLAPAQVSAALGVTVGAGEHVVPNSPNLCGFGGAGNPKRVVVGLLSVDMFTHEKTPLSGITEEAVSGVGDDAHFMTTPGFGTGLSVKKGSFAFKVRVYGFPSEQIKEKEKALAQQVLAKL